ncbi:Galactose/lactose metabolism regulatory protein GAL80 [Paramyrothecium foliicola]|nr:Galactose/lactose metabolism regulatory protein GAL80 [Paramyrothecium foliicola]
MAPIRVGIVGLAHNSPSVKPLDPGTWGVAAHLTPVTRSPNYELVAVCNSSLQSAQKVIESHGLPSHVKAYGNVEEMAADPDVALIVVSVGVQKHFQVAKPAITHKKDVFVEWPLAASLDEAEELTKLAREQGVRTVVGAQIRADPLILKVKELIKSGAIGKVTSSVLTACTSSVEFDAMQDTMAYFLDWHSGGNVFTVYVGHFLQGFTSVLGEFETIQATMKATGVTVPILDRKTGNTVEEAHLKTTPDFVFAQGLLKSGAVASITFRNAKKAADEASFCWLITGTDGEIEVKSPEGPVQVPPEGRTIRLRRNETGETKVVEFDDLAEPGHVKVPAPGTNTARMYEAFATGNEESFATFDDALKTHKLLDEIARTAKFSGVPSSSV